MPADHLTVCDVNSDRRSTVAAEFGVQAAGQLFREAAHTAKEKMDQAQAKLWHNRAGKQRPSVDAVVERQV